jgi:putative membrane protein
MNMNHVRIGVLCTAALTSPALLFSQGNMQNQQQQSQQQSSGGMAGAMNGASGNNDPSGQAMRDKAFLKKASEGGFAEIQLGQLAAQKGGSDEVKQFGQKMVDDHMALNASMQPSADAMGVKAPTKLSKADQAEYDKLNGLSGADFDKEYLSYMVKDHHKDLRDFKDEDATVTDSGLKPAVDKGLQVIQDHTHMADQLYKSKKG